MEKAEEELNRAEHAKFLLYQLQHDMNSSKKNKDCLIQCSDGSYLTSSVIICSLSTRILQLLEESSDFLENPVIIVPTLDLGELLLFFKYFFSNKVEDMFNQEDTIVLEKVCNELEIDFVKAPEINKEDQTEIFYQEEIKECNESKSLALRCKICSKEFINQELLFKHILLDHPQNSKSLLNQCKFCNEIFLSEEECNNHIDKVHQTKVEKGCSICIPYLFCISKYT